MTETLQTVAPNKTEIKKLHKQVMSYVESMVLAPDALFLRVPGAVKLSLLCKTPAEFIKARPVGKDKSGAQVYAPYIPIDYIERALNVVSNFRWGYKVTEKEMIENVVNGTKVYEAFVQLECWIEIDGMRIDKSPVGAVKMYGNPATSKFDVYKSAISNGVKIFAKQIGIGADKTMEYKEALTSVRTGLLQAEWREVTLDDLTENMSLPPDEEVTEDME